jgi:hypothetical protein
MCVKIAQPMPLPDGIGDSQRHTVVPLIVATTPRVTTSRLFP